MNLIFLISAVVLSLIFVPVVRRFGLRLGQVVIPREDRWHQRPIPTLGGIAIFGAFITSLLLAGVFSGSLPEIHWGIIAGSIVIFLLGLYDDLRELTPPAKLIGQIIAAALVIAQGFTTSFFTPRIANPFLAQIPNILLTFVWIIGITNAINLLDNMDGLAGGIAFITAIFLSYLFWRGDSQSLLMISLALAGSVLGFLVYNFPPASIFMGDSGSLFLGFTLAVLAIARQPQASNVFAIMGVPTLLFLLPILDTALVMITRLLRGQSPTQGGRDHTSHRLIAFGLNEWQAVLALYFVALVAGFVGLAIETLDYWLSLFLVPILVLSLALITAYLGRLKVVVTSKPTYDGAFTRLMVELTYRRRLLEIILDIFIIGISYYLAFLIDSGFAMTDEIAAIFLRTLPWAVGSAYISFFIFGIYRGVWRYVGVDDLIRFVKGTLGGVVILAIAVYWLYSPQGFPWLIYLFYAVFLFLGLAASRSSFKILDQAQGQQPRPQVERVLIYGAGDAGEMAVRWMLMKPELMMKAVGFLDDDPYKVGRQIHGVDILGGLEDLETILDQKHIDGVIITADVNTKNDLQANVINICHTHNRWVRTLKLEFELLG